MIRTGVDWSGDPRRKPADLGRLVIVGYHLVDEDSSSFIVGLSHLRRELGLQGDHMFKYITSSELTSLRYFGMLDTTKLRATALCIDKGSWSAEFLCNTSSPQRITDSLAELTVMLANGLVQAHLRNG